MASIEYIGFDNYSRRNCYKIDKFENDFECQKFELRFNQYFFNPSIKAENDNQSFNTVKVVFADPEIQNSVRNMIEKVLKDCKISYDFENKNKINDNINIFGTKNNQ